MRYIPTLTVLWKNTIPGHSHRFDVLVIHVRSLAILQIGKVSSPHRLIVPDGGIGEVNRKLLLLELDVTIVGKMWNP